MRMKTISLAVAAAAAATLPGPAAHAAAGVNDCSVSVSSPHGSGTCDYIGTGAFTVVDFSQNSGDIDAILTCTTFSKYYDYSAHDEVLTGATSCHVVIFDYSGTGGSGSIHVYNKVA
jgi:hypothetical protein